MSVRLTHKTTAFATAALATAALGAGGTALAQQSTTTNTPTDVQVSLAPTLGAGTIAPFDAPGVKAIRRGRAIPQGYVLIGYRIQVHRGAKQAGAALRFQCPGGRRLASFGTVGNAGFAADSDYVHHKLTFVTSWPNLRNTNDADGMLYAICK